MKYMMKVHEVVRYGIREVIVALCDPELVGRTLKEGEVEFFVNPRFYEGEGAEFESIRKKLKLSEKGLEELLFSLLKDGFIYEPKPRRYKVLE